MNKPTDHCLICHQDRLEDPSFYELLDRGVICYRCLSLLKPYRGKNTYKVIYQYDSFLKDLLHQVKGLGDATIAPVFLAHHKEALNVKYQGFTMVPMPSFIEDDKRRGFNHVELIFEGVNLPMVRLFYKKTNYKQATSTNRKGIEAVIALRPGVTLFPNKVLLIDDVITSGETLKTCFLLLKDHVDEIEIVVLSRR